MLGPKTTSRDWVMVELAGEERRLPLDWTSLAPAFYQSFPLVESGERIGVFGDFNPEFHGLSASYADQVRPFLLDELRQLYVSVGGTGDRTELRNRLSAEKIGLILDLTTPNPQPVSFEEWEEAISPN